MCNLYHCNCSSVNCLCAHSAGCIAATKLIWTAVILNGSEASGLLSNVGHLKCIARRRIKYLGGQKGVQANPLGPPLYMGLESVALYTNVHKYTHEMLVCPRMQVCTHMHTRTCMQTRRHSPAVKLNYPVFIAQ